MTLENPPNTTIKQASETKNMNTYSGSLGMIGSSSLEMEQMSDVTAGNRFDVDQVNEMSQQEFNQIRFKAINQLQQMVNSASQNLNLDSINVNADGKLQSLIEAIWFL